MERRLLERPLMDRLPWWATGIVAAVIAYGFLAFGLMVANQATDPSCGLPGGEVLVVLLTLFGHAFGGFTLAVAPPPPPRAVKAAVGVGLGIAAFFVDLIGIGPAVFGEGPCGEDPPRLLAGVVLTGIVAAIYARAGTSARNAAISSATRSGRSSGRK